jgi:hypothetical protein
MSTAVGLYCVVLGTVLLQYLGTPLSIVKAHV